MANLAANPLSTAPGRNAKIMSMSHPSLHRCCALLASLGLLAGSVALSAQNDNQRRGRKYKAPPPAARIEVTILKADNRKPISDAHVIFHPIEGDKDKGYLELKTNEDGKAVIDVLPIGDTVRLQVIANGFQTYGGDYQVDRSRLAWEVCLRRPTSQFSIYKNHPTTAGTSTCPEQSTSTAPANSNGSGNASAAGSPSTPSQNAAPPPDKATSPSNESEAEPNGSPSQPHSN